MEGFKARDISLRAQKKIFSRMASKNIAKVFIDDTSASILDNVYRLVHLYTQDKKEAEKIVKNLIKTVIKLAVVYRQSNLATEDLRLGEKFKTKFNAAALAIISFVEVEFSYDRQFLQQHLNACRNVLTTIVQRHLTEKSKLRVDHVFNLFTDSTFLDEIFRPGSDTHQILKVIVSDMSKAMDAGSL